MGAAALHSIDPRVGAVVLDIGLPDADGRDVRQAMRAAGMTAPVLLLTARGDNTGRLAGFTAGGDNYVARPFHLAERVAPAAGCPAPVEHGRQVEQRRPHPRLRGLYDERAAGDGAADPTELRGCWPAC
jgi:CheY-like chemotaxis protein